ncbi:hypothetical protein [Saccharothrix luteola]|uniref:hypothetical protein n=1 Tax=Saccharothrix luteola TaxID=2893018 RepID=UPI001E3E9AD1|nr:hypothetical protein [Saccharothrix luteola]MCC8251323.1 hypothetical protein [Saccharothrix luteola]
MADDRKARVERLIAEIEAVEAVEALPPLPASAVPTGGPYEADEPEEAMPASGGPFRYLDSEASEPPPARGDTR